MNEAKSESDSQSLEAKGCGEVRTLSDSGIGGEIRANGIGSNIITKVLIGLHEV